MKKIFLVHGFYNSGGFLRKLTAALADKGFECIVPNLKPRDCKYGIENWAHQLKAVIDAEIKNDEGFSVIGYSMGGLAVRYYLQELNNHNVEKFIAISTPFKGTLTAYLYPGIGTRQQRPGSEFLKQLANHVNNLEGIKCYSFMTPFDLMIIPYTSSKWERAENKAIYSPFHQSMVFNKKLHNKIIHILSSG